MLSAGAATYSYDAAGNRSTSMGYTTGAGNEMTSDGTYDYTYDAKGNELTKVDIATGATWTYGYNNANQMTSAVLTDSPDDKSIDYEYDVFGLLIEEEVETGCSTTVTRYAYDGWNPAKMGATGTAGYDVWAVFNSMGSLTSRQLQSDGIDQHLAYVQGGTAIWYLTDHLGSTRATINNSGTVQDSLTYDAYGNMTQSTPCAQPLYTWDGYDYDTATALYLDKARVYDSATGRWITQDPLGFDAGDSNLYRYVNNRPELSQDPSGLLRIQFGTGTFGVDKKTLDMANVINAVPGKGEKNGFIIAKVKLDIAAWEGPEKAEKELGITKLEAFKSEKLNKVKFENGVTGGTRTLYNLVEVSNGEVIGAEKGTLSAFPYYLFSALGYRQAFFANVPAGTSIIVDRLVFFEAKYLDTKFIKNVKQLIGQFPIREKIADAGVTVSSDGVPPAWTQAGAVASENSLFLRNYVSYVQGLAIPKKGQLPVRDIVMNTQLKESDGQGWKSVVNQLSPIARFQFNLFNGRLTFG